jgi:lipopolysaccharide transport system ATP-binding protein
VSNLAIRTEHLGKRYRIGRPKQAGTAPGLMSRLFTSPFDYLLSTLREPSPDEILWALKDVSFEVRHGDAVGIIGRNGAGKSTLLKVLSRITEPTRGRALIDGRVGSLLEVGTGFHPELTGRENIYLSGTILGMQRGEIDSKFDEIVAFAEIERFLDTQVKRYSSGMYVRLAFAVAAHLEPEVLLVDEVLAVGDMAFQKKCLGKMGDFGTQGRTILFVSHNMVAIQNLCRRAIWIHDGNIAHDGPAAEAVAKYLSHAYSPVHEQVWPSLGEAPGNDKVRIRRIAVRPQGGSALDMITMETPVVVEVEYWNLVPGARLNASLQFFTEQQVLAFTTDSVGIGAQEGSAALPRGIVRETCVVPASLLNSGQYRIRVFIVKDTCRILFRIEDAICLDVHDMGTRSGSWFGEKAGAVHPRLAWEQQPLADEEVPAESGAVRRA